MKPRAVFFRSLHRAQPSFLLHHLDEQLAALNRMFDVTLVSGDCDFAEVCDLLQPDLAIFESGVYAGGQKIRNTRAHPSVPRLGFLHADPFDSARSVFIENMTDWGVNWFMTTSMAMAEYTPELADRLFVWPNAVDPAVFRDYGQAKEVEVLFTGSQASHYPWRNAVSRALSTSFTTRVMPHHGWGVGADAHSMPQGEAYARIINAALFAPTCGTMAGDVVRKHLEIPGAMACLVTERTPAVEAFGFRDLVNCVFADEDDVVEKVRWLLDDRDVLDRITRAGNRLVHELHTFATRTQPLQWLQLVREFGDGLHLRQSWPSGALAVETAARTAEPRPTGRDRVLLRDAADAAAAGDPDGAERVLRRALNYYFMPEPAIAIARIRLKRGDAASALAWTNRTIADARFYGGRTPDPVQWATRVRALLCAGQLSRAEAALARYPALRHEELDRLAGAVGVLTGHGIARDDAARRATVCPLPPCGDAEWTAELVAMLAACGQPRLAAALGEARRAPRNRAAFPTARTARARASLLRADLAVAEDRVRRRLSPLKNHLAREPWCELLVDLARSEPIDSAMLMLGPDGWTRSARAVRKGLSGNPRVSQIAVIESGRAWDPGAVTGNALVFVARGRGEPAGLDHRDPRIRALLLEDVASAGGIDAELSEARLQTIYSSVRYGGPVLALRRTSSTSTATKGVRS